MLYAHYSVRGTVRYVGKKKQELVIQDPARGDNFLEFYLSTTCQPSFVLTIVTAAVALSLLTTTVTLHL